MVSATEASARADVRRGLVHLGLERRLLDHVQQVTLLDLLALGEQALLEEALHAGAQVDLVDRDDASDELRRGRDVLGLDLDHRYRGRRRCCSRRLVGLATG